MLIQNENDLLGLLIQNAINDFMNQYDLLQLSGLDHQTYNYYVKSLKSRSPSRDLDTEFIDALALPPAAANCPSATITRTVL